MSLNRKRVFITGGTGGIGRPLVLLLEGAGAIVTVYSHEKEGELAENLEIVCARLATNPPDILINMAGYNEFEVCEKQKAAPMLNLNLLAPIRMTQAVLPGMKSRGSGQIVNIGSMIGFIPLPYFSLYAAAKAGLKGFSDSLRRELVGSGIAVTHISPRAVKTKANSGLKALLNQEARTPEDDPIHIAKRIFKAIQARESDVRVGYAERIFAILNVAFPSLVDSGLRRNKDIAESILSQPNEKKENSYEENIYRIHGRTSV